MWDLQQREGKCVSGRRDCDSGGRKVVAREGEETKLGLEIWEKLNAREKI